VTTPTQIEQILKTIRPCAVKFGENILSVPWSSAELLALKREEDASRSARRMLELDWSPHENQIPPSGAWHTWLFLGGRGAGKTRAGAEWVRGRILEGARRVALVGPTFSDVREVMIEGVSGLRSIGPPDERPRYESSRHRLVWPNGAEAFAFSATDPDGLRGPQFELAWMDEFAAWPEPQNALDTLRMGVRLGRDPRIVITTTPRPIAALRALIKQAGARVTHQPTSANDHNLAPGFVAAMQAAYGGSVLGRQELEGVLIDDPAGALWTRDALAAAIGNAPDDFDRVIVAVDPPVTSHVRSDECGIVVAGAVGEGAARQAFILADESFGPAAPAAWAERVVAAYHAHQADAVVAETNQGGEMVSQIIATLDPNVPVKRVHASRGKRARAEPVAALYSAGRVRHLGHFTALEDQMCAFGAPGSAAASPDRVDALVWAVSELLLAHPARPRLRRL